MTAGYIDLTSTYLGELTAPGVLEFDVGDSYHFITFQYLVENITKFDQVYVRLDGSLDGDNWFPILISDPEPTTGPPVTGIWVVENGTHRVSCDRFMPYIRFNYVFEDPTPNNIIISDIYVKIER